MSWKNKQKSKTKNSKAGGVPPVKIIDPRAQGGHDEHGQPIIELAQDEQAEAQSTANIDRNCGEDNHEGAEQPIAHQLEHFFRFHGNLH
ncbi:MAG: hypothetical protein P8X95_20680 [Anaerolineales bacterium]